MDGSAQLLARVGESGEALNQKPERSQQAKGLRCRMEEEEARLRVEVVEIPML